MGNRYRLRHCWWVIILLFSFFLAGGKALAQEIKRVVVLPFGVHAASAHEKIREELYREMTRALKTSRFLQVVEKERYEKLLEGRRLDEDAALSVAREVGGDFALIGSFTEIGETSSLDLTILDTKERKVVGSFFLQGKTAEGLPPLVNEAYQVILTRIETGSRIAGVEVKGNRKIDSQAVIQVLKTVPGSAFSEARISEDIKSVYKMGYFTHVEAEIREAASGRMVVFTVEERPLIAEIAIQGNRAISKGDLEEMISVKVRQTLNLEKIKEDIEKIRELYNKKGYLNAAITEKIEKDKEWNVKVVFDIKEGARVYIREIAFSGNSVYQAKELKGLMTTKEKGFFYFLTDSGLLNREMLAQDIQKITAFYLDGGFINIQVGDPEITKDDDGIRIKIPIVEGKQFKVGKVDIAGDALTVSRENLLKRLSLSGKIYYDRGALVKDLDTLIQAASDEGYAFADVSPRVSVSDKELKVDVVYHIEKGQPVYFNRINIIGNVKTRDKVIRRMLAVSEGDIYSSSKMKASFAALNRLRYFEEVDFQSARGPAEDLTDLNIQVKEKPTGMFSVGAGYSAMDHAVFTAQVSQNNLFGRGQTLSLKANISGSANIYDIAFIEPWLFDLPLWSKFEVWNSSRDYDQYHLASNGFGVTFGYPLFRQVSGSIGYRLSSNNITEVKGDAAKYIKDQAGTTVTSMASLSLSRDTSDDFIFPTRGSKNSLSAEYAGGPLGGDVGFVRYQLSSSWFYPLPWSTSVGLRGRIGYLEGVGDRKVPVYERFVLGGMNSLRGLRSIGPVDAATGDLIGGLTMFNANLEYIFPLIRDAGMKGVLFYDTGNAWLSGYNLDDLRHTAGFGIRWYSPIGPLRLEWGYVLDRKEGESQSRWEFTIGLFM